MWLPPVLIPAEVPRPQFEVKLQLPWGLGHDRVERADAQAGVRGYLAMPTPDP